MDYVSVRVRTDVFQKLQNLAVPLVDNVDTVLERLISQWESSCRETSPAPAAGSASTPATPLVWRSARGELFPIGAELRGRYRGRTYTASDSAAGIEFNGNVYDNPSSAAIAVKHAAGTTGALPQQTGGRSGRCGRRATTTGRQSTHCARAPDRVAS
jgi:hypothetical protein